MQSQVNSCFAAAWEPSTQRRYSSGVRITVQAAEEQLEESLLPMDNFDKFIVVFGRMVGQAWSTIRVNKSAIRAWHVAQGAPSIFDSKWDQQVALFWRGLKKCASHTSSAKVAVSLDALLSLQQARLRKSTPAGIRDAAWAGVCFFGVRRCADALELRVEDLAEAEHMMIVHIRKQKNDPFGQGMKCYIPRMPQLGELCPVLLMVTWLQCRARLWPGMSGVGLVFCTTQSVCRQTSYDSVRKVVASFFKDKTVGTHTLRKGGAQWYQTIGLQEQSIQEQGGWNSLDCMRDVYMKCPSSMPRQLAAVVGGVVAPVALKQQKAVNIIKCKAFIKKNKSSHGTDKPPPLSPFVPRRQSCFRTSKKK